VKAIVVCCDRIPTRLLGCYGAEWVETPQLERLASRGAVFDALYAEALVEGAFADEFVARLAEASGAPRIGLISDRAMRRGSASAGRHWKSVAARDEPSVDDVPLDRVLSDPQRRVPPVSHAEFKRWTARWRRQLARDDANEPTPDSCESLFAHGAAWWDEHAHHDNAVLWLDVALAEADWIPPRHWRDRRQEEEAPLSLLDPAPGRVGELYLPEDAERVALGWADRLGYFDALLGAFVQSIEDSTDEAPLVIFTAEQGEPVGEHGAIGPFAGAGYEERLQLPLVAVHPAIEKTARRSALMSRGDAAGRLAAAIGAAKVEFLLQRPSAERWGLVSHSDGATTLTTHEWRLIEFDKDRVELYSRPEDRGDMNDLSQRTPGVVDRLQETLANLGATT